MVRHSDVPGEPVNGCASIFVCVSHWSDNYFFSSSFFFFLPFLQSVFGACDDPELGMKNIKSVLPILPLTLFTKVCLKKVCFSPPKENAQHVMSVVNPLNGWPVYRKLELQRHLKKQTKKKKTLLLGRVCWVLPLRFTCNTFKQSKCHRHSQRDVL